MTTDVEYLTAVVAALVLTAVEQRTEASGLSVTIGTALLPEWVDTFTVDPFDTCVVIRDGVQRIVRERTGRQVQVTVAPHPRGSTLAGSPDAVDVLWGHWPPSARSPMHAPRQWAYRHPPFPLSTAAREVYEQLRRDHTPVEIALGAALLLT